MHTKKAHTEHSCTRSTARVFSPSGAAYREKCFSHASKACAPFFDPCIHSRLNGTPGGLSRTCCSSPLFLQITIDPWPCLLDGKTQHVQTTHRALAAAHIPEFCAMYIPCIADNAAAQRQWPKAPRHRIEAAHKQA